MNELHSPVLLENETIGLLKHKAKYKIILGLM